MIKTLNFDMDGTLANTYAVTNWLEKLRAYDTTPYEDAEPMLNLSTLARYLNKARRNGWTVNIVSWLSKETNPAYDEAVTKAKIDWLENRSILIVSLLFPMVHQSTRLQRASCSMMKRKTARTGTRQARATMRLTRI